MAQMPVNSLAWQDRGWESHRTRLFLCTFHHQMRTISRPYSISQSFEFREWGRWGGGGAWWHDVLSTCCYHLPHLFKRKM